MGLTIKFGLHLQNCVQLLNRPKINYMPSVSERFMGNNYLNQQGL